MDIIETMGNQVLDLGTNSTQPVDYPDYAEKLGKALQNGEAERGILLCGSGAGACIAANKMKGIYASVSTETYTAHQGVEHDDMNVLCLGARVTGPEVAKEIVAAFLSARYQGQEPDGTRHARRVEKIRKLERSQ